MPLAETVALVLHPHPHMGGDSTHPFVVEVAARLEARGIPALTPDLRDPDVPSAVAELESLAESVKADARILVGYSWGSAVVSLASPASLVGRVLVAPPVSLGVAAPVSATTTLVLVPEHDQYGDLDATRAAFGATPGVTIEVIRGADHFLWGYVDVIAGRVADWVVSVRS